MTCLIDLLELVISETNYDILRLEISVDNLTHPVHEVKANETLSCQFSYERNGYTFVVVSFDDFQKVDTQNFEDHHKVLSVGSVMDKRIEQLNTVGSISTHAILLQAILKFRIVVIEFLDTLFPLFSTPVECDLIQYLDFVISCLKIMLSTFLDFNCNIVVVLKIFGQPDC